jgi:hypothetical protein
MNGGHQKRIKRTNLMNFTLKPNQLN